jgi:TusA-related sulfurtransferase
LPNIVTKATVLAHYLNQFAQERRLIMAQETLNALGLRCPKPVLEVVLRAVKMQSGDILEVWGDCPRLEKDLRYWCYRSGRKLVGEPVEAGKGQKIQIRL